jgi:hypothetical protein
MNTQEKKWFKRLNEKKVSHAKVFMEPEYRRWWSSVIDKYPDSAHFIYELLQNADDAKATVAVIHLSKTGILFKHNGTIRFTVSDPDNYEKDASKGLLGHLNSITSIGMSTKNEGSTENKIGKFGVGFKAVFQYTHTPEIYDDNVCFRLRDYIIPELIEHDHPERQKGETLFYLPFDREELPAQKAYKIIESKLKALNSPILFLNHLKEISWSSENEKVEGVYRKDVVEKVQKEDVRCENIVVQNFCEEKKDNLWLFTREIKVAGGKHPISVGYYLNEKGNVNTKKRPKIFCYFPTSESLDMCFVMHAPFALVDNRQQIKREEEVNSELFFKLARLAADALVLLCELSEERNKQWINENIFDIVPLEGENDYDDEEHGKWYNYFYNSFLTTLSQRAVHLSSEKKYVTSSSARKVEEPLRQLLSVDQFNQLVKSGTRTHLHYVYTKLKMNDDIEGYLSNIGVNTFDVDDFGSAFSELFILTQDEEWLMKFYKFLLTDSARRLIEKYKLNFYSTTTAPLLTKPFIRNSRKKFVAPYTQFGQPNIFISDGTPHMEGINYVDPVLAADVDFQKLLKKLNISMPDGQNYVENAILPRYAGGLWPNSNEQHQKDFRFILEVYKKCNAQDVPNYIALLEKRFKFRCINNQYHLIEDVIYEMNVNTLMVNRLVGNMNILDRDYYRNIEGVNEDMCDSFLNRFDFTHYLQVVINDNVAEKQLLKRISGGNIYEYGSPRFTDYCLDTFDECCKKEKITEEYSVFIWDSLYRQIKELNKWMYGECSYQPYNDGRYNRRCCSFESSLSISLKRNRWLYNKRGQLCSPSKIFIEDLNSKYTLFEAMINLIGLKHSPQTQDMKLIAEQCSKSTLEATKIGRLLQDEGIKTTEDAAEFLAWRREKKKREEEEKRAAEKKKAEEEERKKLQMLQSEHEEPIFTHKQNKYSVDETFDQQVTVKNALQKVVEPPSSNSLDDRIEKLREEEAENDRLQQIAMDEKKRYTYEWFMALLELEFNASGEENKNKRGIEINFSKVEKDPYSEHGVLLKNPSRMVPLAIEDMNNIAVTFRLPEETHATVIFEVASVQDYILRLKCKNEDVERIDKLLSLSHKIYRAELKTGAPVQLIAKLQEAFFDLQLPDTFNMLENINPNIKFIFGPPGTGKTTYLVNNWIRKVAVRHKKKMLVLCPTNKAADVIAQRAFSLLDPKSWPEDWLFRFVATNEDSLQNHVCMREDGIWNADKCCIISTIARFAYDGFDGAKLKDIKWDYIVIDEASMIPLAQILYPIYRCPDAQIVIAGDPMQIEPIVQEDLWKDENIYKMVQLESFTNPITRPVQFDITNLSTQYRSVPAIGNLFSKYAYEGGVQSDRAQSSQQKFVIGDFVPRSVNFITFTVERMQSMFSAQQVNGSNVHVYSALFAFEFTRFLALNIGEKNNKKPWRIGIVSPYHAQAEIINKLWEQRKDLCPNAEVSIGTVHGFQGDECDIIIAVYNPPASGMVRSSDKTFINKKNILNVAISRAQDYLFILMPDKDYEYFDNLQAKNIGVIAREYKEELMLKTAQEMEKMMFGNSHYLENNTFVTTHQLANVYTSPSSKYEVRIDDKSIDIQIK